MVLLGVLPQLLAGHARLLLCMKNFVCPSKIVVNHLSHESKQPTNVRQGGILTEFREILEDPWEYMQDQWNLLDVTSLTLLLGGAIQRMYGQVDDESSRALYALSAPLAFARILFFAQILPSQGPMIQVKCNNSCSDNDRDVVGSVML